MSKQQLKSGDQPTTQSDFVKRLQQEAASQAKLEKKRFLPSGLDPLTSMIGRYSWQILVVVSGATSLFLEIMKRTVL